MTLYDHLPKNGATDSDTLLLAFLDYVQARGLTLYPAQESAILELFQGHNLILNTPTGSGKSLVASALHFHSIARGRRSVYTCPIKALVNEKWMALCREFGPDNVGLSTGDASVNRDAPILCCTAEILGNIALREGAGARVDDVVMDEFHYYSDRERGVAWQIPLLTLTKTRFLLMSATLGDTSFFEQELRHLTGLPSPTVASTHRPVPLEFSYAETPLAQTLETLVADGKGPVYVVHFTQREAAENAQNFTSLHISTREEKAAISSTIEGFKFSSPYGPEIRKWLKHGIGVHHAGLLPKYRVLAEQLAQKGLLKVICGTDTLGVGINVPIRTVLFTRLCKFDGEKTGILSARDFHQISGRAGRKGFDDVGWVVVQAPEHVIENLKLGEKAARDGKKPAKRKPPEKNFVAWDRNTFQRLIQSPPERLVSRFQVNHGMLLNVLSRPGDGCGAMRNLLATCHEPPRSRKALTRRAWQLFRSLVERRIVEFLPAPEPPGQAKLRVNADLQEDFSMDQVLSLYLIETLPQLDPNDPLYALNLLTVVESILEDPEAILRRQLDRVKTEKLAQLKQEGVDYLDRMEELEKLEHPKPLREFIYASFNAFADRHPWVGQENIRPKSIVREMFEDYRSFADYIKVYELQRAEGLLLRHLSSVHKVLTQTVPDSAKTDEVREMEIYLHTLIRHVDSSLIEEWERLKAPATPGHIPAESTRESAEPKPPGSEQPDPTRNPRVFLAAVRNRLFTILRALASADYEAVLSELSDPTANDPTASTPPPPWTQDALRRAMDQFHADHSRLRMDPEARNLRHTHVLKPDHPPVTTWVIQQVLVDPDDANDWMAEFEVNLQKSRDTGEPWIRLNRLAPISR